MGPGNRSRVSSQKAWSREVSTSKKRTTIHRLTLNRPEIDAITDYRNLSLQVQEALLDIPSSSSRSSQSEDSSSSQGHSSSSSFGPAGDRHRRLPKPSIARSFPKRSAPSRATTRFSSSRAALAARRPW